MSWPIFFCIWLILVLLILVFVRGASLVSNFVCDHKLTVLIKAATDAAIELDWLKNKALIQPDEKKRVSQIVERTHAACEALQPGNSHEPV